MLWLCLLLTYQNQNFYELYTSGVQKLEQKQYSAAVEDLEAAVGLRPESSETARTYGVQFKPYFPYHHLALAYANLRRPEKAREYLDLAYEYEEDKAKDDVTIAVKMRMIDNTIDLISLESDQGTDQTDVVAETPISPVPILELMLGGEPDLALSEIDRLLDEYPDDPSLPRLRELALGQIQTQQTQDDLMAAREDFDQKIRDLRQTAQASETSGRLEEALGYYLTLRELDPEDRMAIEAESRLREELAERGKTEAELTATFEQAQTEMAQLKAVKANLERDQRALEQRNQSLLRRLDEYQSSREIPPVLVEAVWNVNPVSGEDRMAHIAFDVESNIPLRSVTLFANQKEIKVWELNQALDFKPAAVAAYKFDDYQNELRLRIEDETGRIHTDSHTHNFSIPKPLIGPTTKRLGLMLLAFAIAAWFGYARLKRRKAFRERFNPYIAGAPVLNEQMFYGRLPLLKQILNTLHNNSLMIYGERRIGKTSLLHRLNAVLPLIDDPHYEFIPVFVDLQGVQEDEFFATLDHEIEAVLEARDIKADSSEETINARRFISRLRKRVGDLKKICKKKPKLVLLLDEVDVMNGFTEHTNQQLRSVFMKGFAEHIVAVMAGININKKWTSEGSPWYNFFEQIQLKPFSKTNADALINEPVRGVYTYSEEAVARIVEVTNGKPYLIQKLCLNLIAHILTENKRKIDVEDVTAVFSEIEHEFQGAV